MRLVGLVAGLVAAGCYSPSVPDCTYTCGGESGCPSGLTCENTLCRLPERLGTACALGDGGASIDGSIDGPIGTGCSWASVATNVPAALVEAPTTEVWDVMTTTTFTTGNVGGTLVPQADGPMLWLVHVRRFTVAPGVTLTIEGDHPLVIAADEIFIQGTIVVRNGAVTALDAAQLMCTAMPGAESCDAGRGGGGGGYGGAGGAGAPVASGGGAGGVKNGVAASPLRGGCLGAAGGDGSDTTADPLPLAGGPGGRGGGALQLSARVRLTVTGTIDAHGEGGQGGVSDPAGGGACGVFGRASGGGGGGAGGTISVEGCEVTLSSASRLCASGGGGGGGAGGGTANFGQPGAAGDCLGRASGGAGEVPADNPGGPGGYDILPAGPGQAKNRGGGGGGGAVGRIHIREVLDDPATIGAKIVPAPNQGN